MIETKLRTLDILRGSWIIKTDPVLLPGDDGGWDDFSTITPSVFKDKGQYGMFHTGMSSRSMNWAIGYAESKDLLTWRKPKCDPVVSISSEDEIYQMDGPCVYLHDGEYHLFCEVKRMSLSFINTFRMLMPRPIKSTLKKLMPRKSASQAADHARGRYFVLLRSKDPYEWDSSDMEDVFWPNDAMGKFDSDGIFSPCVLEEEGRFYMFYGGSDGKTASTGIAVSSDLRNWSRNGGSPILLPGEKMAWDEKSALIVSILKTADGYCGFYEGEDYKNRYRIGIAYSQDLKHWIKYGKNPILDINRFDGERMVCSPHVICDKDRVALYFTSHGRDMRGVCKMAFLLNNQ